LAFWTDFLRRVSFSDRSSVLSSVADRSRRLHDLGIALVSLAVKSPALPRCANGHRIGGRS
jgi:hypothetical protein